jgi:hypothetical protein
MGPTRTFLPKAGPAGVGRSRQVAECRRLHKNQYTGSQRMAVASSFGDLHVTDQLGELAEAVLVQDEPSGQQLYFIQFRRDSLGRWLIEEM